MKINEALQRAVEEAVGRTCTSGFHAQLDRIDAGMAAFRAAVRGVETGPGYVRVDRDAVIATASAVVADILGLADNYSRGSVV
ncbi:MAG TPA: hypothetical protein VF183_04745 [Acidimicrobiales bacterium]